MKYLNHYLRLGGVFAVLLASGNALAADAQNAGKKLYQANCARCHGEKGEGTKEFEDPLQGDLSPAQLADVISETMPEDKPGSLKPDDAKVIAEYVHSEFYSAIAQARHKEARIELARLTIPQYRQTVADLIGSFRQPMPWGDQRGLKGEYYHGRRLGGQKGRALERIDNRVDFDFGKDAPVREIKEPREFSIRWSGSVLATETGPYEIVVQTDHAARLWLNDEETPLIDAWVKSGDDTEYKATVTLLGGRVYPLRLEYSKATQGVRDKVKKKPSAPSSIKLLWKQPLGKLEPIPSRNLSPAGAPESFICTTPFPPDDRSYGWIRGSSVSEAWDQATTDAAFETAGYVVANLPRLAGVRRGDKDAKQKLQPFCHKFVERAFRRPVNEEIARLYIDKQFAEAATPEAAVKRVVLLTLKSPRFLYREVAGQHDHYDAASRLSYSLWDSMPDETLFKAAEQGRLGNEQQIAQQAERMLGDVRARHKLRRFLLTWLNLDTAFDLGKDKEHHPNFDEVAAADLRTSLKLFLDDVLWSEGSDFRRLLLSDHLYLSDHLAEIYGSDAAGKPQEVVDDFRKVAVDKGKRAGVLTHPYLMARFAHRAETSPIHRGVFLARGILGQTLKPPPVAIAPLEADLHPDMTTRERVTMQTKETVCMTCHGIINPLGFTLEQFDAIGKFRSTEHGKPIDPSGGYRTRTGELVAVQDARSLAEFLVGSEEARNAFVEQLFHHLVQQPVQAYDNGTLQRLSDRFVARDFNIRKLAVDIVATAAPIGRGQKQVAAATGQAKTK